MTSIEPTGGKINDLCIFKDSGLILLALDNSQIPSYFIPALGPAPKWCSYLENLTVLIVTHLICLMTSTVICIKQTLFHFILIIPLMFGYVGGV